MGFSILLTALLLAAGPGTAGIPPVTDSVRSSPAPQEAPVGTWNGTLAVPGGELPIVFHIQASDRRGFTATMDSPAQGATGIPMSEVIFADGHLRLVSAVAGGEYEGNLSADGTEIEGVWRQGGGEYELTLVKEGAVPDLEPTEAQRPIVGTWLGTLEVPGGARLRMVFHIRPTADGGFTATLDSPDQGPNKRKD